MIIFILLFLTFMLNQLHYYYYFLILKILTNCKNIFNLIKAYRTLHRLIINENIHIIKIHLENKTYKIKP